MPRATMPRRDRVVMPRYVAGSATQLQPMDKARILMLLAENSFNYSIHGVRGFELLASVVDDCQGFELQYGDLADAVATLTALCDSSVPSPAP